MATAQDAELILKLYELRREPVLRQARDWFMREFNPQTYEEMQRLCPPGSDSNRFYRMVTTYWEMAAACMVHGAIDEPLFLETSGECMMVWRKVAGWIEDARRSRNQSSYLRNVEHAARRMEAYRANHP
jgi:hypothetical protein